MLEQCTAEFYQAKCIRRCFRGICAYVRMKVKNIGRSFILKEQEFYSVKCRRHGTGFSIVLTLAFTVGLYGEKEINFNLNIAYMDF